MAMDFIGLSVGMGYTDETVIGGGAIKGKNCVISNIEEVADGVNVTFQSILDDGTVKTDTVFIPKGTQGEDGVDGKSAYEIWLEAGNTGTEEDFLISLVGDDGKSAYQYAQDGGYIGTETEFTTNIARSGVISKELEVERARIDNLTTLQDGSTTGDAELIDGRTDYNGKTWSNIGSHIRGVSTELKNDLSKLESETGKPIELVATVEDSFIGYPGEPASEYGLYYNEYSVDVNAYGMQVNVDVHAINSMMTVAYGENDEVLFKISPNTTDLTVLSSLQFLIPYGTKKLRVSSATNYKNDYSITYDNMFNLIAKRNNESTEKLGYYIYSAGEMLDCYADAQNNIVETFGLYVTKYKVHADGLKVSVFRHATSIMGINCVDENGNLLLFVGGNDDLTNGGWNTFIIPNGTATILVSNLTSKKSEYQFKAETLFDFVKKERTGKPNNGMKIVNMGDSLFGNYNDDTSISNQLSLLTGAEVFNCAFGGGQMTDREDENWRPFSMCYLADAIATGDFSSQTNKANAGVSGMPSYFIDHVNTLKAMDFTKVDVITISYGTNDFADNDIIETEGVGEYNKHTLKGALRHSIETIGTAYPNIRFLICTPMWRCWFDNNGVFLYDSDTYKPWDKYLIEYVNGLKDVANEYHLPVCDFYNEIGLNKFNWQVFFDNTDGTHPNANGRYLMSKKLAEKLVGM